MSGINQTQNKGHFTKQVFRLFTDECGGDPEEFADILYSRYDVEGSMMHDDYTYHTILNYFIHKVVPHKIEVFKAGMELTDHGYFVNKDQFKRNLWLHDLSKFSANESYGYAFHDFSKEYEDPAFEGAWHHHKMNNPHHPEYWLNPNKKGEISPLPMPGVYVYEMIADWIGAGRTYGSTLEEWLPNNLHKFKWHANTAASVYQVLINYGLPGTLVREDSTTLRFTP